MTPRFGMSSRPPHLSPIAATVSAHETTEGHSFRHSIIQTVGDDTVTASHTLNGTMLAFRISSSVQERITMEMIPLNHGCRGNYSTRS